MKKENYILLGSLAALGIGAFVWYNANKKIKEKEKKEQINEVLTEVEKSGKASITKEQAKSIAEKLYNSMKDTGTDEDTIITEIRKLNNADVVMVNAAFDKRAYGTFGSPAFGKGTDKTLIEWFREELSRDNLREVEAKFTASGIRGIGEFTGGNYVNTLYKIDNRTGKELYYVNDEKVTKEEYDNVNDEIKNIAVTDYFDDGDYSCISNTFVEYDGQIGKIDDVMYLYYTARKYLTFDEKYKLANMGIASRIRFFKERFNATDDAARKLVNELNYCYKF